jgi:hypothetical protein
MSMFRDLLRYGFLPSQMPPCFTSESLSVHAQALRKHVDITRKNGALGAYSLGTRPDQFSVARSRRSRRPVVIPNPVAQLELAYLIARNWKTVARVIERSPISRSKPMLSTADGRSIKFTSHADLYEARLHLASASRYVLISDISQFFPSLYSHSISWALHGKAKAKRKRLDKQLLGNRLDSAMQHCQHRQTMGIPIGPDTSHIIAELVGAAIDLELSSHSSEPLRGYRHVDDFVFFYDSLAEAEQGLTNLETATRTFELKLNPLKTRIVAVAELLEESWSHELQTFEFSPVAAVQRRQLHYFFELAQKIYVQQRDEAVVRYALGRLSAVIVKKQNWDVFQAHLLRCAVGFPSTVEDVALLLFTYHQIGYEPDKQQLASSIALIVAEHLPLQHHSELAWALWLALHFELTVEFPVDRECLLNSGSTTLLLLLELAERNQLSSKVDRRWLKAFGDEDLLFDEGWLLAYEGSRRKWVPGSAKKSVAKGNALFREFVTKDISFFNPARHPTPLFTPKATLESARLESDFEIGREFEYSERKRGYQGSEVLNDSEDDEDASIVAELSETEF